MVTFTDGNWVPGEGSALNLVDEDRSVWHTVIRNQPSAESLRHSLSRIVSLVDGIESLCRLWEGSLDWRILPAVLTLAVQFHPLD